MHLHKTAVNNSADNRAANTGDNPGGDKLYADKRPRVVDFVFNEQVAAVFPDMIRRSAPGYETIIALLGVLGEKYARPRTAVFDIGCSLGAGMAAVHSRVSDRAIRFVGVDNSAPMLAQCRRNLTGVIDVARLELIHGDAREVEIANASLVVLNFTLQFIKPRDRFGLIKKIYAGLIPGGALILSEKVCFAARAENALQQTLHAQFKTANGYSEMEIAQKRGALENVLTAERASAHLMRLRRAGFSQTCQWFQAFNFCSFIAVK